MHNFTVCGTTLRPSDAALPDRWFRLPNMLSVRQFSSNWRSKTACHSGTAHSADVLDPAASVILARIHFA
jgi:hypothetical protein